MSDKRKSNDEIIESKMKIVKTQLQEGTFTFSSSMTINDFANFIKKPANKIIEYFFKQGKTFNINYLLDEEQIAELCLEYGYDFQKKTEVNAQNFMDHIQIDEKKENLKVRAPIITVMGHVDHGKTTLIDKIRNSKIVNSEKGGITQHTGAYQIEYDGHKITFLDTPGHEAFVAMRSRGAKITDIIILVVSAEDGVKAQTKEAISHAQKAKVPIIVFINKMDKANANATKIINELVEFDVIAEKLGGDIQFVEGSALNGQGIEKLFQAINLQAEMLELKFNPNRLPIGTVIDSKVDIGKGTIATLIVEIGTLFIKDFIVAGSHYGRIRTMTDTNNKNIKKAVAGLPIFITGLNYTPLPGDKFLGFKNEKFAKKIANEKLQKDKIDRLRQRSSFTNKSDTKFYNIIIKADVQGTNEAIKQSLEKIANDEVKVKVIGSSIGEINKSDIILAKTTNASIFSFNNKPTLNIDKFAKEEKVKIYTYSVIYKMIEYIQDVITSMKTPKYQEKIIGEGLIQKIIFFSKIGNIAGCVMKSGEIQANCKIYLIRNNKVIHKGELDSLQYGKDQIKKIESGKDFGCHIKNFNDIKEGDIIKAYIMEEINK